MTSSVSLSVGYDDVMIAGLTGVIRFHFLELAMHSEEDINPMPERRVECAVLQCVRNRQLLFTPASILT